MLHESQTDADENWLHQEASTMTLVASMVVLCDGGKMVCSISSIDTADAKKAKDAGVSVLLKPMHASLTRSDACSNK